MPTVGSVNTNLSDVGTADNRKADFVVLRFRINELIEECNRNRPAEERLHMEMVAEAINVPRSTLAGLTTLTREPVTNSATIEALARFFKQHLPNFDVSMLFEFNPPLEDATEVRVDRLYPRRTAKGEAYREQTRRRQRHDGD